MAQNEIDIDHVVALANAWQKGAAAWPPAKRIAFANDPLNLLAVSSAAKRQKSAADAATWLPASQAYRCDYVARQVGVKATRATGSRGATRQTVMARRSAREVLPST